MKKTEPKVFEFARNEIVKIANKHLNSQIIGTEITEREEFFLNLVNDFIATVKKAFPDSFENLTDEKKREITALAKLHIGSILPIDVFLKLPQDKQDDINNYIAKYCPTDVEKYKDQLAPDTNKLVVNKALDIPTQLEMRTNEVCVDDETEVKRRDSEIAPLNPSTKKNAQANTAKSEQKTQEIHHNPSGVVKALICIKSLLSCCITKKSSGAEISRS